MKPSWLFPARLATSWGRREPSADVIRSKPSPSQALPVPEPQSRECYKSYFKSPRLQVACDAPITEMLNSNLNYSPSLLTSVSYTHWPSSQTHRLPASEPFTAILSARNTLPTALCLAGSSHPSCLGSNIVSSERPSLTILSTLASLSFYVCLSVSLHSVHFIQNIYLDLKLSCCVLGYCPLQLKY